MVTIEGMKKIDIIIQIVHKKEHTEISKLRKMSKKSLIKEYYK